MGCANSGAAGVDVVRPPRPARTPFDDCPCEPLPDVVWKANCQGPRSVHVTGRVLHTGSILEAPFSGRQCVMVAVSVFAMEGKKAKKTDMTHLPPVCAGSNQIGFKIISTIDGRTKEIVIEPGLWEMHFEVTNTFRDIRLDRKRDMLVCKTDDSRKPKDLPKSKDFWDRFMRETGPKQVEVPDLDDKTWKGSLDVHEYALREGDAVAVLGRVKVARRRSMTTPVALDELGNGKNAVVDSQVVIEASGKSIAVITNKRTMAASILSTPPAIAASTVKPEVVPFQQATE